MNILLFAVVLMMLSVVNGNIVKAEEHDEKGTVVINLKDNEKIVFSVNEKGEKTYNRDDQEHTYDTIKLEGDVKNIVVLIVKGKHSISLDNIRMSNGGIIVQDGSFLQTTLIGYNEIEGSQEISSTSSRCIDWQPGIRVEKDAELIITGMDGSLSAKGEFKSAGIGGGCNDFGDGKVLINGRVLIEHERKAFCKCGWLKVYEDGSLEYD